MNDAQEKKQGGRRKGSGRKKKVENRATVKTVSMPDHVWERLNDVCTDRGILRSQVVRKQSRCGWTQIYSRLENDA